MKEITGTIYVCEKCGIYISTSKGQMNSHENECLHNQVKNSKNKDKKLIYSSLDIKDINSKIKEFLIKYNMNFNDSLVYAELKLSEDYYKQMIVQLELHKDIKGIFDVSQFILIHKIREVWNYKCDIGDNIKEKIQNDLEIQIMNTQIQNLENHVISLQERINLLRTAKLQISFEYLLNTIKNN